MSLLDIKMKFLHTIFKINLSKINFTICDDFVIFINIFLKINVRFPILIKLLTSVLKIKIIFLLL